ncbi:putative beta-farnesene synthase [Helianthus annuus]|nr:putative beta-farnesene synthase [Helianthus annuus]KAJ0636144.1 putative beta-farnesene synthase [Helianthus annuus]
MEKQVVEELKEEVRKKLMIKASSNESMQHRKLIQLIDVLQRLGIAYHFEEEIEEALQHIYVTYSEKWSDDNNLQNISLWFRLLRQQGFNISSGIFKNHMDNKGHFSESLCDDAEGMLALYEASYMRVEGEELLDDALEFTKTHLAIIAMDPSCEPLLRIKIQQALKQPLRKRLPRLEAVRYISIYRQEASHNEGIFCINRWFEPQKSVIRWVNILFSHLGRLWFHTATFMKHFCQISEFLQKLHKMLKVAV